MPNSAIVLKHLDTFVAIARSNSFQSAAKELHVTVSAVSRRVKQLEDEVGIALFEREAQGSMLTPAGRQFLELAESVLQMTSDTLASLATEGVERLRVATLNPIGRFFLLPYLADFESAHPHIEIDISVQPDLGVLAGSDFDIAMTIDAIDGDEHLKLATFVGSILCAPQGANALPPPRKSDELSRYTLLCYSQTPDMWNRVFAALGCPRPSKPKTKMYNDVELLLQAAAQGKGIAVGTAPFVNPLLDEGALVDPLNRRFSTGDGIVIKYGPGARHKASAAAFARWTQQIVPAAYEKMTQPLT